MTFAEQPKSAVDAADAPPLELGLEDALRLARALHLRGQFSDALPLYERITEIWSDHPDAWHLMGLLQFHQGHIDDGVRSIRHAITLAPAFADAHANLGNMLLNAGQVADAEQHLNQALELDPEAVAPRVALAVILRARGLPADAEAMLRPALSSESGNQSLAVHNGLANALAAQGFLEEALEHYQRAHQINSSVSETSANIGSALSYLGRLEEAQAFLAKRLEDEPDDATARHMLAACGGAPQPEHADPAYVKHLFDGFANSFDAKLEGLHYRGPELFAAELRRLVGNPAASLDVIDGGCGTGWLGKLIKPYCRSLRGVDLSPGMLERARATGLYDELTVAELTDFLRGVPSSCDIVASADTFPYVGALHDVLAASYAALRPKGWLLFSVELGAGFESDYRIQFHGRYSHRRDYIERELAAAGFHRANIVEESIRMDAGKPVPGLIVTAQRKD